MKTLFLRSALGTSFLPLISKKLMRFGVFRNFMRIQDIYWSGWCHLSEAWAFAHKQTDRDFAESSLKQSLCALYHAGAILKEVNILLMQGSSFQPWGDLQNLCYCLSGSSGCLCWAVFLQLPASAWSTVSVSPLGPQYSASSRFHQSENQKVLLPISCLVIQSYKSISSAPCFLWGKLHESFPSLPFSPLLSYPASSHFVEKLDPYGPSQLRT